MTTSTTPADEDEWWDEDIPSPAPQPRRRRRDRRARTGRKRRWPIYTAAAVACGAVAGGVVLTGQMLTGPSLPSDVAYPEGLTGSQVATDAHGQYVQVAAAEENPLLVWDGQAEHVEPVVLAMYGGEQLAQAQEIAVRFVIEEGIDSPLVFDPSPEAWETWVEEHEGRFADGALDEYVRARGHVVDTAQRDFEYNPRGRSAVTTDGDPQVRLRDLDLQLVSVSLENIEDIRFDFRASYVHDVVNDAGVEAVSHNDHSLSYTLGPDRENESWVIVEWDNHFGTFTDWPAEEQSAP